MKHASLRSLRILSGIALLSALAGVSSAQAVGIGVGPGGTSLGSSGYGSHLGAYKAPGKGIVVKAGPWGGYGTVATHCPPPAPVKFWVPGRWGVERVRVWVAGAPQKVWVEAVYSTQCNAYGATVQVLVTPGHYALVPGPGCWTVQPKKVWVPGHGVWK